MLNKLPFYGLLVEWTFCFFTKTKKICCNSLKLQLSHKRSLLFTWNCKVSDEFVCLLAQLLWSGSSTSEFSFSSGDSQRPLIFNWSAVRSNDCKENKIVNVERYSRCTIRIVYIYYLISISIEIWFWIYHIYVYLHIIGYKWMAQSKK